MTSYNHRIDEKDQRVVKRLLNGKHYKEIAEKCNVSFSTVNNLANGRSRVMRHNYKVYIMLMNYCLMEIDELNMLYRKHLNYILK